MIGNLKAGFHLISTLSWSWSLNHKHTAIGSNEYQSDQIGRKIILPLAAQLLTLQWKLSCQSHKWKNVPQGLRIGIVIVIALTRLEVSYNSIFFFFFLIGTNWPWPNWMRNILPLQLLLTKCQLNVTQLLDRWSKFSIERTLSNAVGATSQVNFNLKTR